MPVRKDHYSTIPVNLEPEFKELLEETCGSLGIARTTLLRMAIKYVLTDQSRIQEVMQRGDARTIQQYYNPMRVPVITNPTI